MKQNYNLLTSSTAFPHAWNTFFQKSKTKTASLLVVLFMLFGFSDAFGQRNNCDNNPSGQLTVNSTCTFQTWDSNSNTSYWDSATGCNSGDYDDEWGWFYATSTSTTITYNSTNDAILHLFTGACSTGMTALACSDNTSTGD